MDNKSDNSMALADEISEASINALLDELQVSPYSNLIGVLQDTQERFGYLPRAALTGISRRTKVPLSRVYGVVTFYSFFTMKPRGKHTVRICLGTACYVRGGKTIAETIEKEFGIKEGETTEDRMFTLESVRCLGACGLGPVVVVDEDVHGRVKPGKVKEILNQYS